MTPENDLVHKQNEKTRMTIMNQGLEDPGSQESEKVIVSPRDTRDDTSDLESRHRFSGHDTASIHELQSQDITASHANIVGNDMSGKHNSQKLHDMQEKLGKNEDDNEHSRREQMQPNKSTTTVHDLMSAIKPNDQTLPQVSQSKAPVVFSYYDYRRNHRQAFCQSIDRGEETTQTDDYLLKDAQTQHPPSHSPSKFDDSEEDIEKWHQHEEKALLSREESIDHGYDDVKSACRQRKRRSNNKRLEKTTIQRPTNPFNLLDFVHRSEKLLRVLLIDSKTRNIGQHDESRSETRLSMSSPSFPATTTSGLTSPRTKSARRVMKLPAGSDKFCSQMYKLMGVSALKRIPVCLVCVSPDGTYLISVQVQEEHSPAVASTTSAGQRNLFSNQRITKEGTRFQESFLSIWNLKEDTVHPKIILHSRSHVTAVSFFKRKKRTSFNQNNPAGDTSCNDDEETEDDDQEDDDERVIAGTVNGSLVVWEFEWNHHSSSSFSAMNAPFQASCLSSNLNNNSRRSSLSPSSAGPSSSSVTSTADAFILSREPSFSTSCVSSLDVHKDAITAIDVLFKTRRRTSKGNNKNQREEEAKCMKQQNKIHGTTTGLKGNPGKKSRGDQNDVIEDTELEEYRRQEEHLLKKEKKKMRQDMRYSRRTSFSSQDSSTRRLRITSLDSRGFICCWILQSSSSYTPSDSYDTTSTTDLNGSLTDSSLVVDTSSEGMFPGSKSKLILEAVIKMPLLFINSLDFLFPFGEEDLFDIKEAGGHDDKIEKRDKMNNSNTSREVPSFTVIKSVMDSSDDYDDSSCLLIASDTGLILQVSRFIHSRDDAVIHSGLTYHQFRERNSFPLLSPVTSIDLHPLDTNLFLAAYADGSVSLFFKACISTVLSCHPSMSEPQSPLMTWDSCDTQVCQDLQVSWLPCSYEAFVTFAPSSSSIVFWDMNISLWNPLFKYQLAK